MSENNAMNSTNAISETKVILEHTLKDITEAIKYFIETRVNAKGSNNRINACSGKGFSKVTDVLIDSIKKVVPSDPDKYKILRDRQATLPGYFRPKKDWDIIVKNENDEVILVIELKSLPTSFGNNFNNRVEECVGSGFDLKTYYEKNGLTRPFVCYLMVMPDCIETNKLKSFDNMSYLSRFKALCNKVVEEDLYSQANMITYKIGDATKGADVADITVNLDTFKSFMENILKVLTPLNDSTLKIHTESDRLQTTIGDYFNDV